MKEILANKHFLILASIWTVVLVALISFIIYIGYKKSMNRDKSLLDLLKIIHSEEKSASWIRWASSFVLISTFSLAYYQQKSVGAVQEGLIVSLVGLALTGKVAQKWLEVKSKNTKVEETATEMLDKLSDKPAQIRRQ